MNKRYSGWPCRSSLWVEGIVIAVCWQPYYSKGCTPGNVRPQVGHYYPSVGWTSLTSPACSIVHIYHGSVGRKYCQDEIIILCCPEKECRARCQYHQKKHSVLLNQKKACCPQPLFKLWSKRLSLQSLTNEVTVFWQLYCSKWCQPVTVVFVCNWTLHSKATATNDNLTLGTKTLLLMPVLHYRLSCW